MTWDDRRLPARERSGVMYQDFFGIKENPFSLTPDPRYLYMAKGHQEALAHLLYGVSEGGGFVLLTGEVGTGKTTVCRCLLEQLPAAAEVALILNPRLDEIELLANICDELGVESPQPRSLKQRPRPSHVLARRLDVADGQAKRCSPVEHGVGQERLPGRVDPLQNLVIGPVESGSVIRGWREAERNSG